MVDKARTPHDQQKPESSLMKIETPQLNALLTRHTEETDRTYALLPDEQKRAHRDRQIREFIDFARQLEAELSAALVERDRLHQLVIERDKLNVQFSAERDEAERRLAAVEAETWEKAAKVAEYREFDEAWGSQYAAGREDAAQAIRALAQKGGSDE